MSEQLVIIAETRSPVRAALRASIRRAVGSSFGLAVSDVILIEPGALPKTTSGKVRRSTAAKQFIDG
jgi:fatty-acyl-CoA synthase